MLVPDVEKGLRLKSTRTRLSEAIRAHCYE